MLALSTILSKIKGLSYMDSCRVQPLTGLCHPIHLWWSWCLYFSFKLVLELGYKRGELCPLVTMNQKENRIPLWALLCKLWHLSFSFPKRNSSSVWAVLGSVYWAGVTALRPALSPWPSSPSSTFLVNLTVPVSLFHGPYSHCRYWGQHPELMLCLSYLLPR